MMIATCLVLKAPFEFGLLKKLIKAYYLSLTIIKCYRSKHVCVTMKVYYAHLKSNVLKKFAEQ